MAPKIRHGGILDDRHRRASELATKGWSYAKIARDLAVSEITISRWFKEGKCRIKEYRPEQKEFVMPPLKFTDPSVQQAVDKVEAEGAFGAVAAREYKTIWFALNLQVKAMVEEGGQTDFKLLKEGITTQMMLGKYIEEFEASKPKTSTLEHTAQQTEWQQRRSLAAELYLSDVPATPEAG